MPLYLCRWPNGDCSIVWARTREEAIVELDQVGDAECCPLTPLRHFQVHFRLTDEGRLEFESLGEGTNEQFFALAYPVLERALAEVYQEMDSDQAALTLEQQARIGAAVAQERERVRVNPAKVGEPETAIGQDIKRQTGMATPLVNRIVRETATQLLEDFKGRGKPH
jgi:hypothetical protein